MAFYVSTGARASELLTAWQGGADPGRQLISMVRKGTGEVQELPASTDAFVWLRLYQLEMEDAIPKGRRLPLWWTLRNPSRPLTYHAAHRMFERVNFSYSSPAVLGTRQAAFEERLRRELTALSPNGTFENTVPIEAVIATRP
ncbi:hypothetical protein ABT034_32125 [Streptomyces sp. NPDC002773]|uniref:hypothetical protein n=1 Tax=Streptomyces sp. NPDC002773 TaxID=3154430 RepID=UPI00332DFB66